LPTKRTICDFATRPTANTDSHWKRNKRKTRHYFNNEYNVIAAVPSEQLYRKARRYLNKKVKVPRYGGFAKYVAISLKKAPNKKRFPPIGKNQSEEQVHPEDSALLQPLNTSQQRRRKMVNLN
jgi:hypothetical protein